MAWRSKRFTCARAIDCAGLAILTFVLPPARFRRDYRLRGRHHADLAAALRSDFRRVGRGAGRSGDLMVIEVAVDQLHLAVKSAAGFVHADARIGRVVETPGVPPWPVLAIYRRRVRRARGS